MSLSLSLRDKVLILMSALTAITLGLYLYVAVRIFRNDKLAEVSYNSAAVASNLATQAHIELDAVINILKPVVQGFDFQTNQLSPVSVGLLQTLSKVQHLSLYRLNEAGEYHVVTELPADTPNPVPEGTINFKQVAATGTTMDVLTGNGKAKVIVAARFGAATSPMHLIAVATLQKANFVDAVEAPSNYTNVIVGEGGKVLWTNNASESLHLPPPSEWRFVIDLLANTPPAGSAEVNPDGHQILLVAYAGVNVGKATVLSYISKNDALVAVRMLITKSILMFIALLCFAIIIAVLASKQITGALRRLSAASKEIATGNFNVDVNITSNDEIGSLAESFKSMAQQLSWYIVQVAEKAALESELNTARTVQETLFPPENGILENIDVVGRYEPASQCGGDWWYYSQMGDRIFMWIGDATGHGVSAALLTSAARSAASIIEMFPSVGPGQALQMMNRAIHETSKGKLLMTFFIAAYDTKTGELTYANASHEPPWLIHQREGALSKKDIIPLIEANKCRLGESDSTIYEEAKMQLNVGDRIFFYTDGVSDLRNKNGEIWGERQFRNVILSSLSDNADSKNAADNIKKEVNAFRDGAKLEDDVTFFICKIKDVA